MVNNSVHDLILARMKEVKEKIAIDFVGLAVYDITNEEIRWRLAVGNTNSRYQRIVIRMGKGIAGEIVQLNRAVKIEDFPRDALGDPIEYPIMLVEHLASALGIPVSYDQRIFGVLLIGERTTRSFTRLEEDYLTQVGKELGQFIEEANIYPYYKERSELFSEKTSLEDVPVISFLNQEQLKISQEQKGKLTFEVLDQSIVKLPESLQESLILSLRDSIQVLCQQEADQLELILGRGENAFTIEVLYKGSICPTKELLQPLYEQMGKINGLVFVHQEPEGLRYTIEIPVWSYQKPFN